MGMLWSRDTRAKYLCSLVPGTWCHALATKRALCVLPGFTDPLGTDHFLARGDFDARNERVGQELFQAFHLLGTRSFLELRLWQRHSLLVDVRNGFHLLPLQMTMDLGVLGDEGVFQEV